MDGRSTFGQLEYFGRMQKEINEHFIAKILPKVARFLTFHLLGCVEDCVQNLDIFRVLFAPVVQLAEGGQKYGGG
jgi:hypothetical protein